MYYDKIAVEIFQILRAFDYEVVLYDEEGNQTYEPSHARRYYAKDQNVLVSISDENDDSSVRVFIGKSTPVDSVLGLCRSLRTMTNKYRMIFHLKRRNKEDIEPKDFATASSLTEGMFGTSKSSYLKLENARLIVRHSARVTETIGARGRNIDSIFVENGSGERMLFPTNALLPARAMVHHVNQGGSWADQVGQQLSRMAVDFADAAAVVRHMDHTHVDMPELREALIVERYDLRKVFDGMCRKTKYPALVEKLSQPEPILESTCDLETVREKIDPDCVLGESQIKFAARIMERLAVNEIAEIAEDKSEDVMKDKDLLGVDPETLNEFATWFESTDPENMFTEKCWDGYEQDGMKKKNGKMVPNCVKEDFETIEDEIEDVELSQEDFLLPTHKADDFRRETISHDSDESFLARMRTLSGIKD